MTPDLSRELARVLSLSSATPAERQTLQEAAGPPDVRSVADLPASARDLVDALRARASQREAELELQAAATN